MADKPVTLSGLLLTLALAALAVVAYYWRLTPEEVALWSAVLAALAALLHVGLSQLTTPLAKPTDSDGVPLTRADDDQPTKLAAAAGRMVVIDGPAGTSVAEARAGVRGRLVWSK